MKPSRLRAKYLLPCNGCQLGISQVLIRLVLLLVMFLSVTAGWAETSSSSLYSDVEQSVYQIKVNNRKTGKKTAIGSGFVVQQADILATNYHVVSTYVNDPEGFELEYRSTAGNIGSLELLAVDVIHDLAVLKADRPLGEPLAIGEVPSKGERLYSLGNPMDKGFSMVEGTNNGMMKYSDESSILFSGNLNPGMSGGPTLNAAKAVVGINVATSGNGLSYLVPARYLAMILERLRLTGFKADPDIRENITEQLINKAEEYIQHLLKSKWTRQTIGHFSVAGDIDGATRCWDGSQKSDPDDLISLYESSCQNESSIYLDEGLEVGLLSYQYIWLESDSAFPPRFYRRYEEMNDSEPYSEAGAQDVTPFDCFTDFVTVSGQSFKMTVCRRDYLHYQGLSDLLITGALVGHERQGMIFNLDLVGTTFDSGMSLFRRMLGEFKWQK